MKKSLVLSIIMTLVMVVAMSTATFAWYSANKSVDAQLSNITAASAAGDLQISMEIDGQTVTNGGYSSTAAITGTYSPCMPTTLLSAGKTWQQGSLNSANEWSSNGSTFSGVTGTIILANKSMTKTGAITATINDPVIGANGKGLTNKDICVVIMKDSTVYASTIYNYGECTTNSYEGATNGSQVNTPIPALEGGDSITLTFYVWFNGASVANVNMGGSFSIGFEFDAADPQL